MTTKKRISNPAKAIEKVDWFLELIEENRNPLAGWEGHFRTNRDEPPPTVIWEYQDKGFSDYQRWIKQKVVELQPLMEEIASRIDPVFESGQFAEHESDGWDRAEGAARRLRGRLAFADEMSEILGPVGPVLKAERLHPWVWNAAVNLWDNGHYKEAVLAAANAVEQQTQLKLGSTATGYKLYAQAFVAGNGTSSPRLRFNALEPDTDGWSSAHGGAKHFGMGCSMGIRNWAAHHGEPVLEQQALEYLAAFSVLARWVDDATADPLSEETT